METEVSSSKLLNTIFIGEVATVASYGAFVRIPGSKQQGLIHRSQLSTTGAVEEVGDVLQRGDSVWCKVISLTEEGKIALSMKVVDQGTGKDLDPNGVQIMLDEQKRKTYNPRSKRKIELEAVLNTTCTKCGTRGHLSRDCFKSPDGKTYDLLPEEDEPVVEAGPALESVLDILKKEKKKKKKEKKTKKEKKKKKKRKVKKKHRKSSLSESSSSEEVRSSPEEGSSEEEKSRKCASRKHEDKTEDDHSQKRYDRSKPQKLVNLALTQTKRDRSRSRSSSYDRRQRHSHSASQGDSFGSSKKRKKSPSPERKKKSRR